MKTKEMLIRNEEIYDFIKKLVKDYGFNRAYCTVDFYFSVIYDENEGEEIKED